MFRQSGIGTLKMFIEMFIRIILNVGNNVGVSARKFTTAIKPSTKFISLNFLCFENMKIQIKFIIQTVLDIAF